MPSSGSIYIPDKGGSTVNAVNVNVVNVNVIHVNVVNVNVINQMPLALCSWISIACAYPLSSATYWHDLC